MSSMESYSRQTRIKGWQRASGSYLIAAIPIGVVYGVVSGGWLGLADFRGRELTGSAWDSISLGAAWSSFLFIPIWSIAGLMIGGVIAAMYPVWQTIQSINARSIVASLAFSVLYLLASFLFNLWWIASTDPVQAA